MIVLHHTGRAHDHEQKIRYGANSLVDAQHEFERRAKAES